LISGRRTSTVYDYASGQYFNIGGSISAQRVNVYDYQRGVHIGGHGNGARFSLYDYGDRGRIQLKVEGRRFTGYDYMTGTHFSGRVNGHGVQLYDYGNGQFYNYSV
jgi:hypothetical protein